MSASPRILDECEGVDALDSFDIVDVAGVNLKSGMILVDPELGTPVYVLSHRLPTPRGSAGGRWFVFDFELDTWTSTTLSPTMYFPAAI